MAILAIVVAAVFLAVPACHADPGPRMAPRALIISIDGLRPDMALRADMPNLRRLMTAGSFTFWARTTPISITLPSHTSMVTGVTPEKHGIHFNDDGPAEQVYPNAVTIFELAHQGGYTTGLVAGKSKFATLCKPGTVDFMSIPPRGNTITNAEVATNAVKMIRENKPEMMMVHFPESDSVGHASGWGSPEQLKAIEGADKGIGQVLDALAEAKVLDQTFIILTADHGGAGKWHGPDDARARHIPWIAVGPGVRADFDLTTIRELNVETYDTFATTAWVLGLPIPSGIDGKVVEPIFAPGAERKAPPTK